MNVYSELWALFRPAGMSLRAEDVGRTLALLPCEEGFLLLFFVE